MHAILGSGPAALLRPSWYPGLQHIYFGHLEPCQETSQSRGGVQRRRLLQLE